MLLLATISAVKNLSITSFSRHAFDETMWKVSPTGSAGIMHKFGCTTSLGEMNRPVDRLIAKLFQGTDVV